MHEGPVVPIEWMLEPTVPMLRHEEPRVPCPRCKAMDWIERPDGTATCGHCVYHAGTGASSTGDFTGCKTCIDSYWEGVELKTKKRRARHGKQRAASS